MFSTFTTATDFDPCLNVHCPRFGVCKTYSTHDARCECFEQCPSYQDPVCTANGTTYDNKCWHRLSYCRGLENNLVYHPGSCEGMETILIKAYSSSILQTTTQLSCFKYSNLFPICFIGCIHRCHSLRYIAVVCYKFRMLIVLYVLGDQSTSCLSVAWFCSLRLSTNALFWFHKRDLSVA